MEEYILKSALVAEIKNLENTYKKCPTRNSYEEGLKDGRLIGYKDALHKINTLGVKEMQEEPVSEDLEIEIQRYYVDWDEHPQYVQTARHFAKWQKEQFEKERLKHCDALTAEQAQIESDFVVNHLKRHNRTPTFIDAIEYGMRLQKENMMAKAIDGYVIEDIEEGNGDFLLSAEYIPKSMGLKDRQKVKVTVIKED